MFHLLAINSPRGRKASFEQSLSPANGSTWFDVAVTKEDYPEFILQLKRNYGNSLGKEIKQIGPDQIQVSIKNGPKDLPFLNIFIITPKNERWFKNLMALTHRFNDNHICELEHHEVFGDTRSIPFEYAWSRSRTTHATDGLKYVHIFQALGKFMDYTDLEEEFTHTQPFKDTYTPIDYNWLDLHEIKKEAGLETELFEGPFVIPSKERLNSSILNDIANEMIARRVYLLLNKIKGDPLTDFIRRTSVSEVTDLIKKDITKILSKVNNETVNNILKGENIHFRKGKRDNVAWY